MTVEERTVCQKCGQLRGGFHKHCDGRWIVQQRTVSDWTYVRPAPLWVDLFGADPNFTDGKPIDEWLDQQRGQA